MKPEHRRPRRPSQPDSLLLFETFSQSATPGTLTRSHREVYKGSKRNIWTFSFADGTVIEQRSVLRLTRSST